MAIYDSQTKNTSNRNSRSFRDLDLDFTRNAVTNDVNVVEDVVAVKRALKNLFLCAHILKYHVDWLHFGFATQALGKENIAKVSIPFDFSESNISHTNVIHTEIMFPKDTLEFLSPNYFGTGNGVELFKSSIFIDDYSEEDNRIVHFVLLPDHLRHIKNQLKKIGDELPNSINLVCM